MSLTSQMWLETLYMHHTYLICPHMYVLLVFLWHLWAIYDLIMFSLVISHEIELSCLLDSIISLLTLSWCIGIFVEQWSLIKVRIGKRGQKSGQLIFGKADGPPMNRGRSTVSGQKQGSSVWFESLCSGRSARGQWTVCLCWAEKRQKLGRLWWIDKINCGRSTWDGQTVRSCQSRSGPKLAGHILKGLFLPTKPEPYSTKHIFFNSSTWWRRFSRIQSLEWFPDGPSASPDTPRQSPSCPLGISKNLNSNPWFSCQWRLLGFHSWSIFGPWFRKNS